MSKNGVRREPQTDEASEPRTRALESESDLVATLVKNFTCSSFSIVIFNTVDSMYVQRLTINFWYVTHFVIMLMMAMVL